MKKKHKLSKKDLELMQKYNGFWNQRHVYILAGALSLIAGLSMIYNSKPKQENAIVKRMSDDEVRRNLIPFNETHDAELSQDQELDFKTGLMMDFGVGLEDIVVDKVTEHSWIVPFDNPRDFSQTNEELFERINSLFQFVNHAKIVKPKIDVVVPKKGGRVIDLTEGDAVQVYAVKLTGDKLIIHYTVNVNGQKTSSDSNKLFYNEGHTGSFYSYSFDEALKRIVHLEQKRGNIFYAPRTALDKVETVPIECLHRAFAPWTAANIHRHIDNYYEDHDASRNMVPWIINRDTEIEEGLVHAISYLWLKSNIEKFPTITQQDLERSREQIYKKDERYKMVEFALDVIERIGLEAAINNYTSGQLNLHVK